MSTFSLFPAKAADWLSCGGSLGFGRCCAGTPRSSRARACHTSETATARQSRTERRRACPGSFVVGSQRKLSVASPSPPLKPHAPMTVAEAEARPAKPEEDDDASDDDVPTSTGDPAADAAAAEARRIKNAKKKAKKKAAKAAKAAEGGDAGARSCAAPPPPLCTASTRSPERTRLPAVRLARCRRGWGRSSSSGRGREQRRGCVSPPRKLQNHVLGLTRALRLRVSAKMSCRSPVDVSRVSLCDADARALSGSGGAAKQGKKGAAGGARPRRRAVCLRVRTLFVS